MELDTTKQPASPGLSLNQSSLNMMQRCPEQYRRRYLDGEKIPPSGTLLRGIAVHEASAHNFTQKIKTHADIPKKDMVEVAVESLKSHAKEDGVYLNPDEQTVGKKTVLNEAEKSAKVLTEIYADFVAPDHQPTAVELKHSFLLPSGVQVHGTLDVETEKKDIPDLKTSAKSPSFTDYDNATQPTMYHMLYSLMHKEPPRAVVIEGLVATKEPKHVRLVIQKRAEDYEAMLNQVDAVARQITAGIFPGAFGQTGAWWCSKNFCGYWSTCQFIPKHKR